MAKKQSKNDAASRFNRKQPVYVDPATGKPVKAMRFYGQSGTYMAAQLADAKLLTDSSGRPVPLKKLPLGRV